MNADLAVAVVSHGHEAQLGACLRSLAARAEGLRLDVVVVDNAPDGRAAEMTAGMAGVRCLRAENRGFAAGNNAAIAELDPAAPWLLLLNPDTEILSGGLATLLDAYRDRPQVGAVGVRQVDDARHPLPTIRWEPHPLRALGEALGVERLGGGRRWLGERELRPAPYATETACDWVSGSFLLLRRSAFEAAGPTLDERFFLYLEETDLCRRVRAAGFAVVHSPLLTVVHRESPRRGSAAHAAQAARSRRLYAEKHFSAGRRIGYLGASGLGYALRAAAPGDRRRRAAARAALATLAGRPAPLEVAARRRA